jgi:hypothetical protein
MPRKNIEPLISGRKLTAVKDEYSRDNARINSRIFAD